MTQLPCASLQTIAPSLEFWGERSAHLGNYTSGIPAQLRIPVNPATCSGVSGQVVE